MQETNAAVCQRDEPGDENDDDRGPPDADADDADTRLTETLRSLAG